MKAKYKTFNGTIEFEVEGSTEKEIFKQIAKLQEVFKGEYCGCCKKNNVRLQVRTVDENDFYELKCDSCGAVFSYGQHKKGNSLFPKRKDENGNWLPNNGWHKWDGKKDTEKSVKK
jgi:predicted adenine nucleotide alpha hydrolase (AANH) superfamily ATPase